MEYLLLVLSFIFGASIGSFINVLSESLVRGRSLNGRSHCDHCGRTLSAFELVPVLSFFFAGGQVALLQKKLSFQYPAVEASAGALTAVFAYQAQFMPSYILFSKLLFVYALIIIALSDLKYLIIPDEPLIFIFILGIAVNFPVLVYFLPGALVMAFSLWLIYHFSSGAAMGYADIKLMFVTGFMLPPIYMLGALYVAFLTGAVVSVILIALRAKKMRSVIPFGPFLVTGLLIALWFY